MRTYRKIIGINESTGERQEWQSAYLFGKENGTSAANVTQALDRNGTCCGWRLYDTPERIKGKIEELKNQLAKLQQ